MSSTLVFLILFFAEINCDNHNSTDTDSHPRLDILLILEHPKLILLNEEKSTADISFEISFEWESKRSRQPKSRQLTNWNELDALGIFTENVLPYSPPKTVISTKENYIQNYRSSRTVTLISEKTLDVSTFPNDAHLLQLKFTSITKNSSQLTLHPHFVPVTSLQTESQFQIEVNKAFVQWVVHKNESFEQAIFEFRITRRPSTIIRVSLILLFILNLAMIFDYFPLCEVLQKQNQSGFYICCEILITAVAACQTPRCGKLTSFDFQLLFLLLVGLITQTCRQILPFLVFHLRCCPMEADPSPPLFPSPSEQFSLDTERSKCNAAIDSARHESIRSPRVANFDMCLAEVKFTMANFNEVLNLHASAEWRRKLWHNTYRRFEILTFTVLQIINLVLFSVFYQ